MTKVNSQNFDEVVNNSELTLVDFYATWCGPCMMQSQVLEGIASSRCAFDIVKVDIDESEDIASRYSVESIPTLFVMKKGKVIQKHIGYMSEQDLLEMVENAKNQE